MLLRRLEGKPVVDRCTCVKPVGEGSFVSKGQLGRKRVGGGVLSQEGVFVL